MAEGQSTGAKALVLFIDKVLQVAGTHEKKAGRAAPKQVVLIGHSMGGLVIKWCAVKNRRYRQKIAKIITIAAPFKGSLKAVEALLPGARNLFGVENNKSMRDLYYWYYGSLAMFQQGGDYWDQWNEAMKPALCKNQNNKRSLCLFGSWDPEGTVWGDEYGGRVYTTAIGALTLEVYYRYSKMD